MIEIRGTAEVIADDGKAFGDGWKDTIVRIRPARVIAFGMDPGEPQSARPVASG